jgi:phosphohistidine phosphatase
MKTLYIVRHAKSSWDDPDMGDFDRPLNERGMKDAPRMGRRLSEKGVAPDLIISSPAARALSTARLIAKEVGYPEKNIHHDRSIYHGGPGTLLDVIQKAGDKSEIVMIVGHNPGLTEFANDLLNENIGNIPTTGVVAGHLKINSWKEALAGCGKMLFFDFPKKK